MDCTVVIHYYLKYAEIKSIWNLHLAPWAWSFKMIKMEPNVASKHPIMYVSNYKVTHFKFKKNKQMNLSTLFFLLFDEYNCINVFYMLDN